MLVPHAGAGGARSRAISDRISANSRRGTATSAIWKVTYRPWLTTFAPILMSFSRRLVSDHGCAVFGIASVRMKLMGWTAPTERHRCATMWSSKNATKKGAVRDANYHAGSQNSVMGTNRQRIHDAGGCQTIWRRRVCRQRAAPRAKFWRQVRPRESAPVSGGHFNFAHPVSFHPCADMIDAADQHGATISRNVADGLDVAQHAPRDRIAPQTSGAAQWITANSLLSPASPWRL